MCITLYTMVCVWTEVPGVVTWWLKYPVWEKNFMVYLSVKQKSTCFPKREKNLQAYFHLNNF